MPLVALQNRRSSKIDSAPQPESLPGQSLPHPNAVPQHSLAPFSSPGISLDSYHHIDASDAPEISIQATRPLDQHLFGSDSFLSTQPSPNNRAYDEGQNERERHAVPTLDEGDTSRDPRELELLKLYQEFSDLSAKRVRVRQSRMALRYKREDELELRVKFMKHLNSFFADMDLPDVKPIMEEYELLQVATEDYLSSENSYRQEENELEELEYMLSVSMESLTGFPDKEPTPIRVPPPNIHTDTGTWSPLSNNKASTNELPCIVNAYLSRIADERILQERLAELDSEWFITVERQAERKHYNISLDEDSAEFLQTFDEERATIWKDLNNAQMDVISLHAICLEEGHRGFDYEDITSLDSNHHYVNDTWEHHKNPLRLPLQEYSVFQGDAQATRSNGTGPIPIQPSRDAPKHSLMTGSEFSNALQQTSSIRSNEFINKWRLHQLRISSMGIWRLQRSPLWRTLREQGWNDHEITQNIINSWLSDETARACSPDNSSLDHADEGTGADDGDADADADTVKGYAQGLEICVKAKRASQSLPSSPRTSGPKLDPRRNSGP
ncbi:uncharacterized protein DSM5745_06754 [Aspergillus mulundensis]|uniref:Uncharacterized protein n=1 Tax=Aspergillus mulundensis TaxID=1810919 RepID=A0A3D8RRR0_9EURO|nr:Uncharacterized protein DSM5745_06754 [Aspergillus mulundensis]RDW76762.1 Uncharacterized protein DSM5745_06754 [Aspergillus mulundensis]